MYPLPRPQSPLPQRIRHLFRGQGRRTAQHVPGKNLNLLKYVLQQRRPRGSHCSRGLTPNVMHTRDADSVVSHLRACTRAGARAFGGRAMQCVLWTVAARQAAVWARTQALHACTYPRSRLVVDLRGEAVHDGV